MACSIWRLFASMWLFTRLRLKVAQHHTGNVPAGSGLDWSWNKPWGVTCSKSWVYGVLCFFYLEIISSSSVIQKYSCNPGLAFFSSTLPSHQKNWCYKLQIARTYNIKGYKRDIKGYNFQERQSLQGLLSEFILHPTHRTSLCKVCWLPKTMRPRRAPGQNVAYHGTKISASRASVKRFFANQGNAWPVFLCMYIHLLSCVHVYIHM